MLREGIRFTPPKVEVPAAVDWLLARAVGPHAKPWEGRRLVDSTEWTRFVGCHGLIGRVRWRAPRDLLQADLGEDLLAEIDRVAHRILAAELLQDEVCSQLAALAAERSAPRIFLKGMALRFGGHAAAGVRQAGDIDVLMSRTDAGTLQPALVEQGCRELDLQRKDHQLTMLMHPLGVAIEIHVLHRGIRLWGEESSTAEETLSEGDCRALEGWPAGTFIPGPHLLTAHLLVHGLAQHGFSPGSYPLLQLLADLQDLEFAGEQGEASLAAGFPWIESDVSWTEVRALREVLQRLAEGERISRIVRGSDSAAIMARHLIAGSVDAEYRQSLKIDALRGSVSEARSPIRALARLSGAVWLTRSQIDRIYGRPESDLGYLGRRLWRPVDLVGRTWRTLKARRILRSRI